ncbi:hypothetical protein O181_087642 [Austropuccinia psidii MF-1]|uniref:Uncharacterized protein n=1 Tax=Austropuccinia psidii MF-1 TaxID=1389203 RepID=A0A9Q3P3J5_9BASI|nr:hypothetical protein [Austropuccinia psidii MF-1]
MLTTVQIQRKRVYAIEQVAEEQSQTEDSESNPIDDVVKEHSDDDKIQKSNLLNLCKHTKDAQTFPVTPATGMAYINETDTKITIFIDNAQHPLIIVSGSHCAIVAREYSDNHFPNLEKKLFPNKSTSFKSALGKITSFGTIIKEITIPHRKGHIRLNPNFVVLEDAHIQ